MTRALRGDNVLRGFDEDMRDGAARRHALPRRRRRSASAPCRPRIDKTRRRLSTRHRATAQRSMVDQVLLATGRRAAHARAGPREGRRRARRATAPSRSTRILDDQRALDLRRRRRHRTGSTSRRWRSARATPSPTRCSAASRRAVDHANVPTAVFTTPEIGTVGLTRGTRRATAYRRRRHLPGRVPAAEGDALGPPGDDDHEDRRRRRERPRARRPHPRRTRPARWRRSSRIAVQDGRDQGRLRRHHGGAPDGGRGTRHHAHPHRARYEWTPARRAEMRSSAA